MKLGVVGMGSIGRRHVRALDALGVRDVVALRTDRGALRELPADLSHVQEVRDEDAFWRLPLGAVLVTNPTSLHGAALARAAERGLHTFVEKPLVGDLAVLPSLSKEAAERVVVGFCLRFHPLVEAMRAFLAPSHSAIGRVMKARLSFGHFLPGFHPDVDYRTEYMSRRDLGGGVLRTMCHELDLVQHLLGPVVSVAGEVRRVSDLEIDMDDSVMLVCRTKTGVSALVELDYLNPQPTREGSFLGSGGKLDYSFRPPLARFVGHQGSPVEVFSAPEYSIDEMYRTQMEDFLGFVRTGRTRACTYAGGVDVMRIIAAAERLGPGEDTTG